MTIRIADELRGSWSTFWATTFTFEVGTFEDFVLPRLGGGSVAATVIADQNRLAREWARVSEERHAVRANRDYLVRGIDIGGSFHAKTLLLAARERVRLLVGSGNLTLKGLGEGEVFTRFEGGTPEGNAALAAWRSWMQSVVDRSEDLQLQSRWLRVADGLPDVGAVWPGSPFISNQRRSILEVLVGRLPSGPVDELHLAAPFWDEDCSAFTTLLQRIAPKRVVLYLHNETSVSGKNLRRALEKSPGEVMIRGWSEYVHAKLIGVVAGAEGVLLSGSPNLSNAALTLPAERHGANVEAATIARGTEEEVRMFFQPPDVAEVELGLDELERFQLEPSGAAVGFPIKLIGAVRQGDGRIRVGVMGAVPPQSRLSNGLASAPMADDGRTRIPLDIAESRFVRVVTDQNDELSNVVPVDLPDHLEAFARPARDNSKPTEFERDDMGSPVGWLLGWLHGECVFDIDEAVPRRGSETADEEEVGTSADDDFWDRLQRDELRGDPRLARYAMGATGPASLGDEVFLFLEMMLQQAPETQLLRLMRPRDGGVDSDAETPGVEVVARRETPRAVVQRAREVDQVRRRSAPPVARSACSRQELLGPCGRVAILLASRVPRSRAAHTPDPSAPCRGRRLRSGGRLPRLAQTPRPRSGRANGSIKRCATQSRHCCSSPYEPIARRIREQSSSGSPRCGTHADCTLSPQPMSRRRFAARSSGSTLLGTTSSTSWSRPPHTRTTSIGASE